MTLSTQSAGDDTTGDLAGDEPGSAARSQYGRRGRHAVMAALLLLFSGAAVAGVDGQAPFDLASQDHSAGFSVPDAADVVTTVPTTMSQITAEPDVQAGGDEAAATTIETSPAETAPPTTLNQGPLACLQSSADGPVWRLSFSDEFEGDEVNTDDWDLYNSPGNAGFGLRRPSAITQSDGFLVLTAQMINDVLVSGGMAHRSDQIYGRWEFRVRTEPDPSEATSGVVLTWPQSNNWPLDGENDMYETERRADRTPFKTYIHYGADNSQEFITHDANGTEWHDIAMEWTADRIAMFRDGAFVGEITSAEVIPDVPHHMTVQLDAWVDVMGDPVRMFVDWVRVYSLDEQASSC